MFPSREGICLRVAGVCLLWIANVAHSQAAESTRVVVSPLVTLGKLAVALVIVLAVFWLFARVMRKVQGFQGEVHQSLKVVGALSVGQRERVIVVQAGEEQLVLGVTSSQINTLHVLERPLIQPGGIAQQSDFKAKLSSALKRQVTS